jgi:hypothetical protein
VIEQIIWTINHYYFGVKDEMGFFVIDFGFIRRVEIIIFSTHYISKQLVVY